MATLKEKMPVFNYQMHTDGDDLPKYLPLNHLKSLLLPQNFAEKILTQASISVMDQLVAGKIVTYELCQ